MLPAVRSRRLVLWMTLTISVTGWIARAAPVDATRVRYLEILGQVWGRLYLLHPRPASEALDWSRVLIDAIPKVEQAATPQQFIDVLNTAVFPPLRDPLTIAQARTVTRDRATPAVRLWYTADSSAQAFNRPRGSALQEGLSLRRLAERVVMLDATNPGAFAKPDFLRTFDGLMQGVSENDSLVVDLRFREMWTANVSWLNVFLRDPEMTGSQLSRTRRGWCESTTCGPYGQDWTIRSGQVLRPLPGRASLRSTPVFIVNNTSYPQVAVTLDVSQRMGARVVLERSGSFIPGGDDTIQFAEGIEVRLGTRMLLSPSGRLGAQPDHISDRSLEDGAIRKLVPDLLGKQSEPSGQPFTVQMNLAEDFPRSTVLSRETRLAGWFKLWTAVWFLFPQVSYASNDWSQELGKQIPAIEAATTLDEYYRTLRQITATLNDSHVVFFGEAAPKTILPAEPRPVQGQSIVVRTVAYPDGSESPFKVGDVLLAVNGKSADEINAVNRRLTSASTPGSMERYLAQKLAWTWSDDHARVTVGRADGRFEFDVKTFPGQSWPPDPAVPHRILEGNIGYLSFSGLTADRLYEALETVRDCAGLILDPRGQPAMSLNDLMPHFIATPADLFARHAPILLGPEKVSMAWTSTYGRLIPDPLLRFSGPLVVLIDDQIQSSSENFIMPLYSEGRARFVGSPTAGTTGDTTIVRLPGGGSMSFTGTRAEFPDGRRFQNVGFSPHVRATPTIAGIRQNRDEILEAGVKEMKRLLAARSRK